MGMPGGHLSRLERLMVIALGFVGGVVMLCSFLALCIDDGSGHRWAGNTPITATANAAEKLAGQGREPLYLVLGLAMVILAVAISAHGHLRRLAIAAHEACESVGDMDVPLRRSNGKLTSNAGSNRR